MYPEITLFSDIKIYSYGLILSFSIATFLWMLRKTSRALEIKENFFFAHILWYFIAVFAGSRLFHVIFYWGMPGKSSFSFEHPILSFFTMSDFYFSLAGAIAGFVGILYWKTHALEKEEREKIYDSVVISILFASCFAYIGAFLGGQTYGVLSRSPISVDYSLTNPNLGEFPRFPLGIIYFAVSGVIFSFCYILRKARQDDGLVAYLGTGLFALMVFLGEFWNPSSFDILSDFFGLIERFKFLNINQLLALALLYWSVRNIIIMCEIPVGKTAQYIFQTNRNRKKKKKKKRKKSSKTNKKKK